MPSTLTAAASENKLTNAEMTARYERLSSPVVYDILDKMGFPDQALAETVKPLDPSMKVFGPAFTIVGKSVLDHGDDGSASFEMIRRIVPGSVLILAGNGHRVAGPWGENISISSQLAGARGMVTDTGVRDAAATVALGFPVFSAYVSPVYMAGRFVIVGHQQPVQLAGQTGRQVEVAPGDFVVGDRDGVVIVPGRIAQTVLEAAEELERIEVCIREAMLAGEERESVYRRFPKFAHVRKTK